MVLFGWVLVFLERGVGVLGSLWWVGGSSVFVCPCDCLLGVWMCLCLIDCLLGGIDL